MSENDASQELVKPYPVRFHTTSNNGSGPNKSYQMQVVHERPDEHLDGWIDCHDADNDAGLSEGRNWRDNVGRGGPGKNVSWSPF